MDEMIKVKENNEPNKKQYHVLVRNAKGDLTI